MIKPNADTQWCGAQNSRILWKEEQEDERNSAITHTSLPAFDAGWTYFCDISQSQYKNLLTCAVTQHTPWTLALGKSWLFWELSCPYSFLRRENVSRSPSLFFSIFFRPVSYIQPNPGIIIRPPNELKHPKSTCPCHNQQPSWSHMHNKNNSS